MIPGQSISSADDVGQSITVPMDENLRSGLALLWRAYMYAQDARVDLWDFALEIDNLYETGLTISDLRWLVAKGLVEHGRETSVYGDSHRSFHPSEGFNFDNATCLVLTPRGATLANRVSNESAVSLQSFLFIGTTSIEGSETAAPQSDRLPATESHVAPAALKPHWNPKRRELCLAGTIVKRFRVPAPNQEIILCVFQEEGWPEHIDDPLPVSEGVDSQTRLHDAINRLNGHQTNPMLRFHGNGNGTGVCWELRNSEWPQKARAGTKPDFKVRT
jgi:hypothetical protein